MADLHFRQPPTITEPQEAAFWAQKAPIPTYLAGHSNGETGRRNVDSFFGNFREKTRGKRKIQQNILQFSCTACTLMSVRTPKMEVRYRLKGVKNEAVQQM
jgi:hypothetical protein